MKMNFIASLSLLITCLAFSGQSFSHWGNWGKFGSAKPTCIHHNGTNDRDQFSYAILSFDGSKTTTNIYIEAVKGSHFWLTSEIAYTNDELKNTQPHFPYAKYTQGRTHIIPGQKWFMGFKERKSGEKFSCRIGELSLLSGKN